MKRSVSVEIAGQRLSILSDEPTEYVAQLAQYVDDQVSELCSGKRPTAPHRAALLVALHLADELFREKDANRRFRARVESRLTELEAALAEHEKQLAEL
ncbi:MAG: cell division protein ZapA [Myxococcales bacterium FL481]|nr:MAG: cell division protein ZapA [Myxococcales bacterium FL481]